MLEDALLMGVLAGAVRSSPAPAPAPGGTSMAGTYASLLGLTLLNPVTVVYFGAMVLGNQRATGSLAAGLVFVLAAFAASASWQVLIAAGGAILGRVLTSGRGRLATAVTGNLIILALAVNLVVRVL